MSLLPWKHPMPDKQLSHLTPNDTHLRTLADIQPGEVATIDSYLPAIPTTRKTQLLAYGLLPGLHVQVIQRMPVTIIRVEQTELALEAELTRYIAVR